MRTLTTYPALVGAVIRDIRLQRRLSQATMANGLGLTPPSYSRLESGRSVLSVSQVAQLSTLLNISPSELFARVDAGSAAMQRQGVQVISEREPDLGDVVTTVLIGAALGVVLAAALKASQ